MRKRGRDGEESEGVQTQARGRWSFSLGGGQRVGTYGGKGEGRS